MTPFLQFIFFLVVVLLAAKSSGYLSTRLGQPSVLGELFIGLALGPSLLNIAHLPFMTDPALNEMMNELGQLGVLMLMFIAGLELRISDLMRNMRVSALSGTLGVLFPVGLGWSVGRLFGHNNLASIFLGLTMGATSVSISAQTLMELKALRSRIGLGLLGAAVFDDILVILLLSGFLAVAAGSDGFVGILWIFLRMIVFLGLSAAFGIWALPYLERRVSTLPISQGVLTLALVVMLLYGLAAELVGGMAAITGSFLAGLMFARSPEKNRIETGMVALSYGLFVPIFFVSIGLNINLRELQINALWLMIAVSLVAILSKWLGAGLGARLGGFTWEEAKQLGAGMVSRGEVGLIVATVGLHQNLIDAAGFSAVAGMVLISTLVTPPLLRSLIRPSQEEEFSKQPVKKEAA